ncbi:MAG: serine hydrolase domain-containing protein [Gammaproteobacteria bacterium]|nr:serine hydrolase domain-containing protein [Gammaproteobacteria bacterium]
MPLNFLALFRISLSVLIVFFTVSPIIASANSVLDKATAQQQLSDFIEKQLKSEDAEGLSIAIVHGSDSWFSAAYGLADAKLDKKASTQTQYRIGSVSSLFTAMLILKLESENKLSLDDKISKYFPELPFATHDKQDYEITIKQLLTHHSGLPLSVLKNSWAETPPRFTDIFHNDQPIYFSQAPDTIYTYSNVGYALLGMLIEKLTGLTFEQAMTNYLLEPLGMQHTGFVSPSRQAENMSKGYKKGKEKKFLYPRDLPSLGMYSSARDMEIFLSYFLSSNDDEKKILDNKQIQKMLRIQNIHVAADLGKKVGLGWMIGSMAIENAGPIIWRGGASLYHRSRVVLLPKKNLGVVVFANDSGSWDLVESVATKALTLALEVEYGIKQPDEKAEDKWVEPYGVSDDFAEHYNSFAGFIPVVQGRKSVKAELLGWTVIAKPDGRGWYKLQYDLFGIIPINLSWITSVKVRPAKISNYRVLIVLYQGTQHLFASHINIKHVDAAWRARVGEYHLRNPDSLSEAMEIKTGKLMVENDQLFFLYQLPLFVGLELKVPIKILNKDEAIIPGLGTALNETISVKSIGNKEILEYSGYQLEKK